METKVVQKKKADVPNGSAQFKDGKMLLPVLENGKIEMQTTEQLKKLLDKKDRKQEVDKSAKTKAKQGKKVRDKKIADASYRMKFVDLVIAKVPEITKVEKDDRIVLKFNTKALCRLMVRAGHRFTCYRKVNGSRDTIKIINDKDEEALLKWIQNRIELLKSNKK